MGFGIPNFTAYNEQIKSMIEDGPLNGEALVEYSVFLSDSFGRNPSSNSPRSSIKFLDGPGVPRQIDGYQNDDSYRQSRHFVRNNKLDSLSDEDATLGAINLRENSLARQIQAKRDQPAIIRLLRRTQVGTKRPKTDDAEYYKPWVNIIPPNTKFFLEQVTENREEKVQVLDTFGEFIAFFFGSRPEVYTYQGTLLNSVNHDWKNEFQLNYENFLRGSQAVKHRATMFLQYDDVIVEGYMLSSQIRQTGVDDVSIPFTFNLLVLNRSALNPVNILVTRSRRQKLTEFEKALLDSLQDSLALTDDRGLDDMQTFLLMREWINGQQFPSAGNAIHFENTNKIKSDKSKKPEINDGVITPDGGFRAKHSGTAVS